MQGRPPARFFRRAARIIDIPWGIAGGSDLRLPGVPGPRPLRVRISNSYLAGVQGAAGVQAAAAADPVVGPAFLRVAETVNLPDSCCGRPSRYRCRAPAGPAGRPSRRRCAASHRPGAAATTSGSRHRGPGTRRGLSVPPVGIEPTLGPF